MKFLIAFAVVIAVAVARPDDKDAHIISQQGGINLDGSYTTNIQTSNGIAQSETGQLKQVPGAETPSYTVKGAYEYLSNEGETVRITYTADEQGYRAEGSHVPKI